MVDEIRSQKTLSGNYGVRHGLRTPGEEFTFTARPKIKSQIFRYSRSIFCLPHRPKFSDFFDLCLHLVSVVRDDTQPVLIFSRARIFHLKELEKIT